MGFFSKLKESLIKTKSAISSKISQIFTKDKIGDDFYDDLLDILISSDISVNTAERIIDDLHEKMKKEKVSDKEVVLSQLREVIKETLDSCDPVEIKFPAVIMVIGVNGVGKTTSIGKLANYYTKQGKQVTIAAADTFRAAATEQLDVWAERAKVRIIKQGEGSDPSAVVFDAVNSVKSKKTDLLIIDTAGRLHVKANLMEELKKMSRVVAKEYPQANFYKFIVLDATTGQNSFSQVELFNEAVGIDGIILTKLDGSAKGGFILSLADELQVPVSFVGVGEKIDDIVMFDSQEFAEGLVWLVDETMSIFSKKKTTWFPLDNAAKIYPPTANSRRPHVFCFSAILDGEIEPDILKIAVQKVLNHYPSFKTRLKRGAFWYYLEENKKPIKVFEEQPYYLKQINYKKNNDFLFEVMYIRNKITVKFFHALTDGTGGFKFFSEILIEYLAQQGHNFDLEEKVKPIDEPSNMFSSDDSFRTYENNVKNKVLKPPRPYAIKGTPFDYDGCGMITAEFNIVDIKRLAKEVGVSITSYLASVYSYSVYESFLKDKQYGNTLVTVLVPCNLRNKYGGETMRNFSMFARVMKNWNKDPSTIEKFALSAQEQILEGTTKEKLDKIIHDNVKTEKNLLLKSTPLFLKNLIMRLAHIKVGENLQTVDFSNLGLVNLPEGINNYVKKITFAIAPTFSCGHQTGVIGYNGKLYITFSRNYTETYIEKNFIRFFTEKGIDVKVDSNYWESRLWNIVNIVKPKLTQQTTFVRSVLTTLKR